MPGVTTEILLGDILDVREQIPTVDMVYVDPPFYVQKDFGDFDDRWSSKEAYVEAIMLRLISGWEALRPGGNFLVHLDWHAVADIRVALDSHLFDGEFQNEIIWKYNSGGASKRRLSRKHDNILWFTKDGADHTYNVMREPYPHKYKGAAFHPDGKMLSDVWTDIGFIGTSSTERVGYATQKPVKLLERIVALFTNPGDVVLDFYCGSGTTGVAASNLGRSAILIDKNPEAIRIASERLSLSPA